MERTVDAISIWYWARDATNVPVGVADGNSEVITDNWVSPSLLLDVVLNTNLFNSQGTPVAFFPTSSTCDLATEFTAHNIVINCRIPSPLKNVEIMLICYLI